MFRSILTLALFVLSMGCSEDKKDKDATPAKQERLPPEVENGPEQALQHYQQSRPR